MSSIPMDPFVTNISESFHGHDDMGSGGPPGVYVGSSWLHKSVYISPATWLRANQRRAVRPLSISGTPVHPCLNGHLISKTAAGLHHPVFSDSFFLSYHWNSGKMSSERVYSSAEIAEHNSRESCWIVVHGTCNTTYVLGIEYSRSAPLSHRIIYLVLPKYLNVQSVAAVINAIVATDTICVPQYAAAAGASQLLLLPGPKSICTDTPLR